MKNEVTGSLYEKNGIWQMSVSFYVDGKRKQKSRSTKLPVRGNKKKALEMLEDFKREYRDIYDLASYDALYFHDYLSKWMERIKDEVRENTYVCYTYHMKHIIPYFKKKMLLLREVKTRDISDYYKYEFDNGMSPITIKKYHANIHKALVYAVRDELISNNPATHAVIPKAEKFEASFYTKEEMNELMKKIKGSPIEVPVILTCYYGFRRSEVLGLKWSDIDFEEKTIHVQHTLVLVDKKMKNAKSTKNESSNRIMSLNDSVIAYLSELKRTSEYVCVNKNGEQFRPDYLSSKFKQELKRLGMREIRFHDLRHSSASLLLDIGFQLKDISEWLGHADIQTTANIYSHLTNDKKHKMASSLSDVLSANI